MVAAMSNISDIVAEFETFCREVGMAETTFGLKAVNNSRFFARLRRRGNASFVTIERARTFIQQERQRRSESPAAETASSEAAA
jgi:hypothetical protein